MLDMDKIHLKIGQIYKTSDQGLCRRRLTIKSFPPDKDGIVETIDEAGSRRFREIEIVKNCIALKLWKLTKGELK